MIYFIQRVDGLVKIGTTRRWASRFAALKREEGPLTLLGWQDGGYWEETLLHGMFRQSRANYKREWFHPTADLLDYITKNAVAVEPDSAYRQIDAANVELLRQIQALQARIDSLECENAQLKKPASKLPDVSDSLLQRQNAVLLEANKELNRELRKMASMRCVS